VLSEYRIMFTVNGMNYVSVKRTTDYMMPLSVVYLCKVHIYCTILIC